MRVCLRVGVSAAAAAALPYVLRVHVKNAVGLLEADATSASDPFVKLRIQGESTEVRTKVWLHASS
jgi:hypothetical protein